MPTEPMFSFCGGLMTPLCRTGLSNLSPNGPRLPPGTGKGQRRTTAYLKKQLLSVGQGPATLKQQPHYRSDMTGGTQCPPHMLSFGRGLAWP